MDILGKRKIFFIISLFIIVVGLLSLLIQGLNWGIDFQGGTLMEYAFEEGVTSAQMREVLGEFGLEDSIIQDSAEPGITGLLIRTRELAHGEITTIQETIMGAFEGAIMLRTEMVGPTIGEELRIRALYALLIAAIAIIVYISYRFQFRFAIAALLALIHDVLIVIGLFSVFGHEVNTPFVAGLLTIMGYSINDSIVIFDRIRENTKFSRRETFISLANRAVVDTLPRSINTSVTTLLAVVAVLIFGGASIRVFMITLLMGIIAGAYSSIFIASPLLVEWDLLDRRKGVAKT